MSISDYSSSVPLPVLTEAGFVVPSEQDILNGVLTDIDAALGGDVNTALDTPQGQLAVSQTAILGDAFAVMLALFNGMDPKSNSGRMQEAIGRIYFLTRRPATPTVVETQITTTGGSQTITAGTPVAVDREDRLFAPQEDVTLPNDVGQTQLVLKCLTPGAVPCAFGALSLYQAGLGISSLTNVKSGEIGREPESRAEFEARRERTVAANSIGQNAAILGALLSLQDLEDAYVVDNPSRNEDKIQGVTVAAHSLYIVVQGGADQDIGRAIIRHKSPGCATQGSICVEAQDENPAYRGVNPIYKVCFDRVEVVPLYITVKLARSDRLVPQDASARATTALMQYLTDAETRPRIGSTVYASRLATSINSLGDWADVLELSIGTDASAGQASLNLAINHILVADETQITVFLSET